MSGLLAKARSSPAYPPKHGRNLLVGHAENKRTVSARWHRVGRKAMAMVRALGLVRKVSDLPRTDRVSRVRVLVFSQRPPSHYVVPMRFLGESLHLLITPA